MNIKATIIELQQGSEAWLQHRAKSLNASDLAAAMGLSKYMTRAELVARIATGIVPEVDANTQRRFDRGHECEAIARPWAEEIIGESLYPVTLAAEVDGLHLSASLDGQDLLGEATWEHKQANAGLIASLEAGVIPDQYHPQMEQGLMLSGASRCMFMASNGDRESMRYCWYESNPTLRAKIIPTWQQVMADVAAYVPTEVLEKPVAKAVTALPAVSVQVSGEIAVRDNFPAFEVALRDFIDKRLIRKPETDQDFADLDLQIKALKNAEEALNAAEAQMLAQVSTVDTIKRTKDMLHKLARDNRLMAEKLLAARKEEIKAEIVAEGVAKFRDHVAALNTRLGKPYMPAIPADFGGAVKGKRTVDSLREAVGNELTRVKIEASAIADRIDANLKHLRETASEYPFLFADTATIVLKAPDDLQALVLNRLNDHHAAEQKRRDAEREQIRAEEAAKLQREAEAKAAAERAEAARVERERAHAAQVEADRIAREQAEQAQAQRIRDEASARDAQTHDVDVTTGIPKQAPFERDERLFKPAPVLSDKAESDRMAIEFIDRIEALEDTGNRLTLGQINERLSPVSINVAGLSALGFDPVEQVKASRFYRECDLPAICRAISDHVLRACAPVEA